MRQVSELWKKNQRNQFTSDSHIRLTLQENPMQATQERKEDNTLLSIAEQSVNNVSKGINNTKNYGTLELNRWLLDDSIVIPIDRYPQVNIGLISKDFINDKIVEEYAEEEVEKCYNDAVGTRFSWSIEETSRSSQTAITITFDSNQQEYAVDFDVLFGNQRIKVRDNSVVTRVVPIGNVEEKEEKEYGDLDIIVYKWCLPNRRARIDRLFLGYKQVWTNNDILSYRYRGENSPILTNLPREEIRVQINDNEGLYHPLYRNSLFASTKNNVILSVEYGFTIKQETQDTDEEYNETINVRTEFVEWMRDAAHTFKHVEATYNAGQRILEISSNDVISHYRNFQIPDGIEPNTTLIGNINKHINHLFEVSRHEIEGGIMNNQTIGELSNNPAVFSNINNVGDLLQLTAQAWNNPIRINSDSSISVDNFYDINSKPYDYTIKSFMLFEHPEIKVNFLPRSVMVRSNLWTPEGYMNDTTYTYQIETEVTSTNNWNSADEYLDFSRRFIFWLVRGYASRRISTQHQILSSSKVIDIETLTVGSNGENQIPDGHSRVILSAIIDNENFPRATWEEFRNNQVRDVWLNSSEEIFRKENDIGVDSRWIDKDVNGLMDVSTNFQVNLLRNNHHLPSEYNIRSELHTVVRVAGNRSDDWVSNMEAARRNAPTPERYPFSNSENLLSGVMFGTTFPNMTQGGPNINEIISIPIKIHWRDIPEVDTYKIRDIDSNGAENVVIDNPIINNVDTLDDILENIYQWLSRKHTVKIDCRIDPRLELLDRIKIETEFGERTLTVTSLEITYEGSFKGKVGGVLDNYI